MRHLEPRDPPRFGCDLGVRPKPRKHQRSLVWSSDPLAVRTSLATLLALSQIRRAVLDPAIENLADVVLDLSLKARWDPTTIEIDHEPIRAEYVVLDDAWIILVEQDDQWLYAHGWGLDRDSLSLKAIDGLEDYLGEPPAPA